MLDSSNVVAVERRELWETVVGDDVLTVQKVVVGSGGAVSVNAEFLNHSDGIYRYLSVEGGLEHFREGVLDYGRSLDDYDETLQVPNPLAVSATLESGISV